MSRLIHDWTDAAARDQSDAAPADATADFWHGVFGNDLPVAIEIGPGRGEFLTTYAHAHHQHNILGIERSRARAAALQRILAASGLTNARVIAGDAPCVLAQLPDQSVAAYHVQFPDPWWKRRHQRRRLFTLELVGLVGRTLTSGGTIELVTDVPDYFEHAQKLLGSAADLEPLAVDHRDLVRTTFARKAEQRGVPLHRSVHRRRVR